MNASVFTVADAILFRPPPWDSPERVVYVYQDSEDGEPSSSSFPAARDMAESDVFEAVAAVSPDGATWDGPDGPVGVSLEYATSGYLDVLGLRMTRGRWFGPEDDVVGAAPAAVVSHGTWRTRLGIRMALGAGRGQLVRMVIRAVALTVALGLAAGVALAMPVTAILDGILFGVSTRDPLTFAGAVVFILLVAVAAAWLPARRAAGTDPAGAPRVS